MCCSKNQAFLIYYGYSLEFYPHDSSGCQVNLQKPTTFIESMDVNMRLDFNWETIFIMLKHIWKKAFNLILYNCVLLFYIGGVVFISIITTNSQVTKISVARTETRFQCTRFALPLKGHR